jgi:hypothetical protein
LTALSNVGQMKLGKTNLVAQSLEWLWVGRPDERVRFPAWTKIISLPDPKWLRGPLGTPRVKRSEHEADHSPEGKNAWSYTSTKWPELISSTCCLLHRCAYYVCPSVPPSCRM